MRQSIIGMNSQAWKLALIDVAILAGSIPSGDANIVALRAELSSLAFGPGFLLLSQSAHVVSAVRPDECAICSGYVYIGTSFAWHLATPWLDPTVFCGDEFVSFAAYLYARADLVGFLRPLLGKLLVCSCALGNGCHGHVLRDACNMILDACVDCELVSKVDMKDNMNEVVAMDKFLDAEDFSPSKRTSRISRYACFSCSSTWRSHSTSTY